MVRFTRRSFSNTQLVRPSSYLDVQYNATQESLLDPSPQDFTMQEIMSHAHGKGAEQALAKRKLDAVGNLRGVSGFANDPKRLKALKAQLDISVSLADISRSAARAEAEKKAKQTNNLIELAPDALIKLKRNNGVAMKLTKREICAVAFASYGAVVLKESLSKPALAAEMAKLIAATPSVLEKVVLPAREAAPRARPQHG